MAMLDHGSIHIDFELIFMNFFHCTSFRALCHSCRCWDDTAAHFEHRFISQCQRPKPCVPAIVTRPIGWLLKPIPSTR